MSGFHQLKIVWGEKDNYKLASLLRGYGNVGSIEQYSEANSTMILLIYHDLGNTVRYHLIYGQFQINHPSGMDSQQVRFLHLSSSLAYCESEILLVYCMQQKQRMRQVVSSSNPALVLANLQPILCCASSCLRSVGLTYTGQVCYRTAAPVTVTNFLQMKKPLIGIKKNIQNK